MGNTLEKTTSLTNWIYLGLIVFVVAAVLLNNVNLCGSVEFCTITVFVILFMITGFALLLYAFISSDGRSSVGGTGNLGQFMFQGIDFTKILWVPIGVISVLAVSFGVTLWDFQYAPFVGIFFSGLIIFTAFLQTHSVLVPILIHGIYNSLVVAMREGGIEAFTSVAPEVGVSLGKSTDFFFEIMLQNALVAPSEEFFRIFTLVWIVVIFRGNLKNNDGIVWLGVFISTFTWTILHLIQF